MPFKAKTDREPARFTFERTYTTKMQDRYHIHKIVEVWVKGCLTVSVVTFTDN